MAERTNMCKTWFVPFFSVALFLCLLFPFLPSPPFPFAPSAQAQQQYPQLPSETPTRFTPSRDGFDHVRRDVMIPMRDGVKLHTVILVPNAALGKKSAPILMTRTPYEATALTSHAPSAHLSSILQGYDNAVDVIVDGGYIRVVQDIRGKYKAEGDYVLNRPIHGPQNPTPIDEATDADVTDEWPWQEHPATES